MAGRGDGWRPGSERATMSQVRARHAEAGDAMAMLLCICGRGRRPTGLVPQRYLDSLDPVQREALWDTVLAETIWPRAWGIRAGRQLMTRGAGCPGRARPQAGDVVVLDANQRARRF
jgi:hypothetical protein